MRLKKRLIHFSSRALVEVGVRGGSPFALRVAIQLARRLKLDPRLNKAQMRRNLRFYFPDRDDAWLRETARALEANAVRARVFDKHLLPTLPDDELFHLFEYHNGGSLDVARESGRGAIVVSLHYGRFWAAPAFFTRKGYMASAIQSSKGKLPSEADLLSAGSLNARDPRVALRATRDLKRGGMLFLLVDAGRVPNPIVVDFLGKPTLVSPAPVRLARAANAVILPGVVPIHPEDPERVQGIFLDAIDPSALPEDEPVEVTMRRVLEPLEAQILRDPSQWYGAYNAHRRLADPALGGRVRELV